MLEGIREKLNSAGTPGIAAMVLLMLAAVGLAAFAVRRNVGPSSAARHAAEQVYMCTETGKTFTHTLKPGQQFPLLSPHSGKKTAYPADVCWWTKDGKLKNEPTYLVRNTYRGEKGPTFCPECDRLFSTEAPPPTADMKPPMTRQQYRNRRSNEALDAD